MEMPELKKVIKSCCAYVNATKVPAFVIDAQGRPVEETPATSLGRPSLKTVPDNPFCCLIQESPARRQECFKAHLYGSYQADKFGEAYVFFCPFGLVHWVAPILSGYHIQYSLVAGPVIMSKPEDTLIEEILQQNGLSEQEIIVLQERLGEIPYLEPGLVNDLAILLFSLAGFLSETETGRFKEKSEFFAQQKSICQCLQEFKNIPDEGRDYPFVAKEKELMAKIRRGDKAGAQEILNEILGYVFFSQGNDLELIKTRVVELVVLLSRAAVEGGAEIGMIFGLNHRFLWDIERLSSVDEIAFWLSKVMVRFTDCVFNLVNVKNVDIIYKAVSYLRANYMQEISLDQVAEEVHLSPAYFSKLFKNEMKCTFSEYLSALRIEYSKELLLDEDLPLVEVAGLVGFKDQSYFSKVFKKLVGVSPGEFRRSRGA